MPMKLRQFSILRLMAVAGALAGAVWLSGVRLFAFPGKSMAPTVMPGDYFIGFVGLWGARSPQRFDLIIFDVPADSNGRAVGFPG